jgi:prephenate dehydrogenase
MQTGAASERARISAILGSESAKGREATAQTLALTTDMDAATAETVLASVPKQATGDVLSKMAQVTHVSPDAGVVSKEARLAAFLNTQKGA